MKNKTILYLLLLLIPHFCISQNADIKNADFIPPLKIPLYLSGTFGELRSNHFHSGIDIKTQGTEGKQVIAIGDGWVSRIKISLGGYGKALYITHPNGFVSVYGHLQRFNSTIQKMVVDKQYERESFEIQIFPKKNEITVKKGDIIAYSGNTGGSMGPHLHFEIREEKSQHPVNPLLNKNIKIKDFYRPSIKKLIVYPVDTNSIIAKKNDTLAFDVSGWGEKHTIKNNAVISASGRISFGISTIDLMNDISNKNGVYNIKLFQDTLLLYNLVMDKLSFNTTRYINSLIDYQYFMENRSRVVRTEIDTNNLLGNYKTVVNNGIIEINDTLIHNFKFVVTDAYNNTSILKFKVKGSTEKDTAVYIKPSGRYFAFNKKNAIFTDSMMVSFAANSYYRSFYFNYQELKADSLSYSTIYKLHNNTVPVQKYFNIMILPNVDIDSVRNKLYVAYSANNIDYYYSGSGNDGKYVTSRARNLGYYKIMIDAIPPDIKLVNIANDKNIAKGKFIKVKINDKQTGIKSYRATLNGHWILMEYDAKKHLLIYRYDKYLLKGNNEFKLVVIDLLDNVNEYSCNLIY